MYFHFWNYNVILPKYLFTISCLLVTTRTSLDVPLATLFQSWFNLSKSTIKHLHCTIPPSKPRAHPLIHQAFANSPPFIALSSYFSPTQLEEEGIATLQSNTHETPFNLVYDIDAMVPVEVSTLTWKKKSLSLEVSEEGWRVDLDLINQV